jgi:TnpA family transposase
MVRHYMLSSEDLALINRRRGDPNRLGFALMLCYLRFPGRILQQGEQPPAALCAFVAEQLGLDAAHFGDYAERDQTRREHVAKHSINYSRSASGADKARWRGYGRLLMQLRRAIFQS